MAQKIIKQMSDNGSPWDSYKETRSEGKYIEYVLLEQNGGCTVAINDHEITTISNSK